MKELNRFNDPDEVGIGNETDTFKQVIEDQEELLNTMRSVKSLLFEYTTDNAEVFSSEISTIEDKEDLLSLKKALISARDCFNIVRTFGDDDLKEKFKKLEIENLSSLISEVQHCIDSINQKEAIADNDATKQLINEAMQDISFKFSKLTAEELRIIANGNELEQKWKQSINAFIENIDQDDPEYITLRQAFVERFKEHGFVIDTVSAFEKHCKELDEVLKKLAELQIRNSALLKKYRGDSKFARVHKRIREENVKRVITGDKPIISPYEDQIQNALLTIKDEIDQKVYDRNDILKKDEYFERTVMQQITMQLDTMGLPHAREDRVFIQSRVTGQYLNQYNATYGVA
jgi:type I restriction enzyme R subunit